MQTPFACEFELQQRFKPITLQSTMIWGQEEEEDAVITTRSNFVSEQASRATKRATSPKQGGALKIAKTDEQSTPMKPSSRRATQKDPSSAQKAPQPKSVPRPKSAPRTKSSAGSVLSSSQNPPARKGVHVTTTAQLDTEIHPTVEKMIQSFSTLTDESIGGSEYVAKSRSAC